MGESKSIQIDMDIQNEQDKEEVSSFTDDYEELYKVPCLTGCGNFTTWDPIYGDLCYRCVRADNE